MLPSLWHLPNHPSIKYIHLFVYLSIHPSINTSIHSSICLSLCLSIQFYSSIFPFVCHLQYLSICFSIHPSVYLCLSICLTIHTSFHLTHGYILIFYIRAVYVFRKSGKDVYHEQGFSFLQSAQNVFISENKAFIVIHKRTLGL